jgi:hypothetical protein
MAPVSDSAPPMLRFALMGRPTIYTEELAAAICARLSEGEAVTKICADADMPCRATVCTWRHAHPEFQAMYARAREDAGDIWAERALQAAMNADPVTANSARLKFDALRWYTGKIAPRTYGDKVQHSNAAGDDDPAVHITYSWAKPAESRE